MPRTLTRTATTEPTTAPARPVERLRAMGAAGSLDLPLPSRGETAARWRTLAEWGHRDLVLARLAEGHVDGCAILAEAGREPVPGALYGVWAARSGGTGARLAGDGALHGTVRFCSGAHDLDRALVVADTDSGTQVLDVGLDDPRVCPVAGSWRACGMQASDSADVTFDGLPVDVSALVGGRGFYTDRPGFWWGGGGVAAVWLGGAAGALEEVLTVLGDGQPDQHQLAHVGTVHAAIAATEALLAHTAAGIDSDPASAHRTAVLTARASAEHTARVVLDVVPRLVGSTTLCRDERIPRRLADLGVYVRQHHGERDLAALGLRVLDEAGAGYTR